MNEDTLIEYVHKLKRLSRSHDAWRTKRTLNLIASENASSEDARAFLSTDLSNRYTARDHFYRGTRFADEIEQLATEIAKRLFRCKFADVRPISGHTCSLILFMSFLRPGNKVVTCPPKHGGYPGSSELGLGRLLHLQNLYFPYDAEVMNIVPGETQSMVRKEDPEMIVYGSSFIPFPYDIRGSLPIDYSGVTAYDASHVLGLIAGGEFQMPLSEGCDILMGSTHKSLFGPQGGLILSNSHKVFSVIDANVYPGIVDNIHWNRVTMLAYSLLELLKFGKQYACQVIRNSKAFAKALHENHVPVRCASVGYTESHQVLLGYDERESVSIADALQGVDIITDVGIRLGTSEITRHGMKEHEMERIAELISDLLVRKASKNQVARGVHKLVRDFEDLDFVL
jgi:glycine hydroxymethyltransferase